MITKNLKIIFILALLSRVAIFIIAFTSSDSTLHFSSFLKFIETFTTRWDGHSYLSIAQNGYVATGTGAEFIVFQPFYPFLTKLLEIYSGNLELSAFWISNVFFFLSQIVFYKLLLLDFSPKKSLLTVSLLIFFPVSYFFSSGFPESLFIFLLFLAFYFARVNKFLLASLFSLLASLTRPFGFLIWPAIFVEWLLNRGRKNHDFLIITIFAIFAVSTYLVLNSLLFGNPLAFKDFLQSNWGKTFVPPWISIVDSWKRGINTTTPYFYKYLVGYGEAIAASLAWFFIPLIFIKKFKIKSSYVVYYLLGVIISTSSGFLLSVPRYILSLPPFFIILSNILNSRWKQVVYFLISIPLLLYLSIEFSLGHWTF